VDLLGHTKNVKINVIFYYVSAITCTSRDILLHIKRHFTAHQETFYILKLICKKIAFLFKIIFKITRVTELNLRLD